jgi:hypothetical protein
VCLSMGLQGEIESLGRDARDASDRYVIPESNEGCLTRDNGELLSV